MQIQFIEIQNFRKLKSVRIDFAKDTTLLVGANNSGKTSAMLALRRFLMDQAYFVPNDFTLSGWTEINAIGTDWIAKAGEAEDHAPDLAPWERLLPTMDVWLHVETTEIHYVNHLLPTLDWVGGLIGVRLRLEPKKLKDLYQEFLSAARAASKTIEAAKKEDGGVDHLVELWPRNLRDFLDRRLRGLFHIRSYILDPTKCEMPVGGKARPQTLDASAEPLEGNPFDGLIRIDEINAQRGFSDSVGKDKGSEDGEQTRDAGKLSGQLRAYYAKHLDPSELPEPSDLKALHAIDAAQTLFDARLKVGFGPALQEVESLGYPGVTDPRLIISTNIKPIDGLNHSAAVQYEVIAQSGETATTSLRLPEEYNGLGYQNLISIVFRLMSFRDGWMQVGKAAKRAIAEATDKHFLPPLHIVLVEEPEAHLHAQVQQVFIRRAYQILRAHKDLGDTPLFCTQLIVSTHSSHIAHECSFSGLRYFRRLPASAQGEVPISTVINMSEVFGAEENETEKFVIRYLKATHCDLFFADAAILVEGPAERMLLPHFIRTHFPGVNQAYVTILEIGGSHAHRLQKLIEHLGLLTMIYTDLDAADATGNHAAQQPVKGKGQITRNPTLKTWIPAEDSVDTLLGLEASKKQKKQDHFFAVRVAYQIPVEVAFKAGEANSEALSNTFEDALVFENLDTMRKTNATGLAAKFRGAIEASASCEELGAAIFDILKTGNKAQFALDILYSEDPKAITVPTYIREGLEWLQTELNRKQLEIIAQTDAAVAQADAET